MSGTDVDPLSSDPAHSEVLETKANDDHALEQTTVNNEHAADSDKIEQAKETRTKPIRIPVNSLALSHEDPEATPTAPSAFSLLAHTPTSSSSLRAELEEEDDNDDQNDDARSSHLASADDVRADSPASPSQPQAGPSEPNKTFSVPVLRARLCRAAAHGDLETILSILHPSSPSAINCPSSFTLVNSPTSSGLTPLLEAASHGHLNIVQHLIAEEGAVRDLEDYEGENAFLKASYRGHLDIMKYLAGDGDGAATNDGSSGERGGETDINAQDREGWSALHNAASKGYLEVVMWLAENGASIDARSTQGYTVSDSAAGQQTRCLMFRGARYKICSN
jgi:ankyrin repeat protein